jgi:hypothetical protein
MNNVASCGAIFRDSLDSYLGSFTGKLKCSTMLHATLFSIILAILLSKLRFVDGICFGYRAGSDYLGAQLNIKNRPLIKKCKNNKLKELSPI